MVPEILRFMCEHIFKMAAVCKGKVRGQNKMGAHQFRCDPTVIPSFEKFRPVVSEEFSGNERGGGGGGVRLKT